MKTIRMCNQFKKDLKKIQKQGKRLEKLDLVVRMIAENKSLDTKYRDHKLLGNYQGKMECHIEPNWLLIYSSDAAYVYLYRTGSHANLFMG